MKKKEIDEKYNHDELPKVKNWFLYVYRAFMKLFFYLFFGTGSIVLALLVFPWIRVFVHPKRKFQTAARAFVSGSFRFFINFMRLTGTVKLKVEDREKFKNLHSKIIIANHPSMLDFVFIMSPTKSDQKKVIRDIVINYSDYNVAFDDCGAFSQSNPQIPLDNRFHAMLLDKNNNVVLIGNPLYSNSIWELMKEALMNIKSNDGLFIAD